MKTHRGKSIYTHKRNYIYEYNDLNRKLLIPAYHCCTGELLLLTMHCYICFKPDTIFYFKNEVHIIFYYIHSICYCITFQGNPHILTLCHLGKIALSFKQLMNELSGHKLFTNTYT